jgi:hypothetical protein
MRSTTSTPSPFKYTRKISGIVRRRPWSAVPADRHRHGVAAVVAGLDRGGVVGQGGDGGAGAGAGEDVPHQPVVEVLAFILEKEVIERILRHTGETTNPPRALISLNRHAITTILSSGPRVFQ